MPTLFGVPILFAAGTSLFGLGFAAPFNDTTLPDAVLSWCAGAAGPDYSTSSYSVHGPIEDWDTSRVTTFYRLFLGKGPCNPPIGGWNTAKVRYMQEMFYGLDSFNQPLPWNTESLENMKSMFEGADLFNQPLPWNTAKVTNMEGVFWDSSSFNQPLEWDTSRVTKMDYMFYHSYAFNQPLFFDTSRVQDMSEMFNHAESFNQPLSFNTSGVELMYAMFDGATAFHQNLESWNTDKVTECSNFCATCGLPSFAPPSTCTGRSDSPCQGSDPVSCGVGEACTCTTPFTDAPTDAPTEAPTAAPSAAPTEEFSGTSFRFPTAVHAVLPLASALLSAAL